MAYIINIDTAEAKATINIAKDGKTLHTSENPEQKDHAAFIQSALSQLLKQTALSINSVNAVAVTAGPGSYTGLRVGMASAKGLCYALNIPLITLNTLEVLTKAVIMEQNKTEENLLFCPMMDARRMEVYTAIYDATLNPVLPPCALVLNSNSFVEYLLQKKILFFGSGTLKWENISTHLNALYTTVFNVSNAMSAFSFLHFKQKQFANLNFVEPFYLKEFATINKL